MIIKGKERGDGAQFGPYLLDTKKNEHVEVHEVRGFMAGNVKDALLELDTINKGTRCENSMFTVVLSPPEYAEREVYDDAIKRIEEKMGLAKQPRLLVYHENDGRRHAHCVWSRIDSDKMRAINLPFFKNRLMEISKQLYLDYGWKLPEGFIDREKRNPLNFTTEELRRAERLGDNPKLIRSTLQECWSISKTKAEFEKALEQHGYYLARGNRRAYVAIDWRGEVYSLTRETNQKKKILTERLGEESELPSADEIRAQINQKLISRLKALIKDIQDDYQKRLRPLNAQKSELQNRHLEERKMLEQKQSRRWQQETKQRQLRMNKGFRGIWDLLTGRHSHIAKQNELEAYQSLTRDRVEKDRLIEGQLKERKSLQKAVAHNNLQLDEEVQAIKSMLFSTFQKDKSQPLQSLIEKLKFGQEHSSPELNQGFDLST